MVLLPTKDPSAIQSKEKSRVTKVQREMKVLLMPKDRPAMQSKVKYQVANVQQ